MKVTNCTYSNDGKELCFEINVSIKNTTDCDIQLIKTSCLAVNGDGLGLACSTNIT